MNSRFTQSVRHSYRGVKPVTQWFKYHVEAHKFKEGEHYICTFMSGKVSMVDWLLTPEAATQCGLGKLSEKAHSVVPTVVETVATPAEHSEITFSPETGVDFPPWVYLVVLRDGTFKIGYSRDIWQRSQTLGGRVRTAASHDNAFQVEQAAHAYFKPYNIGGEFYSADLPYKEVSRFIQLGLTT